MFLASSVDVRPIAPTLRAVARNIEERSPGLRVLAARLFRYPVQQQEIDIRAEVYRKINLLEKFILRASSEISPSPSLEDVARALGLDLVFVKSAFKDLDSLQSVTYTENSLRLTEEGEKSLASEQVAQEPIDATWYLIQDRVLGTTLFAQQALEDVDETLEDLSPYLQKDLTQFPLFELNLANLQPQFEELGLDLHDPEQGRFVTRLQPVASPELRWKSIAIFVFHDTLNEGADTAITFQARSDDQPVKLVAEWLESQLQEQNLSLKTLCGLSEEESENEEEAPDEEKVEERQVEERLEDIRQQATTQLRRKVEGQAPEKDAGTAIQLRDAEIRHAFLTALQNAREQIIIYSPWMNEQVVDDAFLSLLETRVQQGVRILIGYGIGRHEKREERPVSPDLTQRLRTIQTVEGTPGIIAEWLGNSHAKEILIDQSMHFSGSHNWLSYRGDRFPRGETVYQVTIATEVEKAYHHLSQRFVERAQDLWSRSTREERETALCILGYLGREQAAIEWIQLDARYRFIPLWLALARQAIASGQEARLLASLQTVITLCCTKMEPQNIFRAEIITALQNTLQKMARKNPKVTAAFFNENLPALAQLGIDAL